jgi:hypothetical protein
LALFKVETKQQKKGDGELVHHGQIDVKIRLQDHLLKIVKISTCQLVTTRIKHQQIPQFSDFGWNWSYSKSRQNSEKRGMVKWFTTVLFDVEIYIPSRSLV